MRQQPSALGEWAREARSWIERLQLEAPTASTLSELELLIRQQPLFARRFVGAGGPAALRNILEQCNQCACFTPEPASAELTAPAASTVDCTDPSAGEDVPMLRVGALEATLRCIGALIELRCASCRDAVFRRSHPICKQRQSADSTCSCEDDMCSVHEPSAAEMLAASGESSLLACAGKKVSAPLASTRRSVCNSPSVRIAATHRPSRRLLDLESISP